MTYLAGRASGGGEYGFAGRERADFGDDAFALLQDRRPAGAVDSSIDASAAEQGRVGGVDDGFGCFLGDVGGAVELECLIGESEASYKVGHGGSPKSRVSARFRHR
jgi:hypothetical protein